MHVIDVINGVILMWLNTGILIMETLTQKFKYAHSWYTMHAWVSNYMEVMSQSDFSIKFMA